MKRAPAGLSAKSEGQAFFGKETVLRRAGFRHLRPDTTGAPVGCANAGTAEEAMTIHHGVHINQNDARPVKPDVAAAACRTDQGVAMIAISRWSEA
jgi:hypothetical protein